jgi:hypothetical protein
MWAGTHVGRLVALAYVRFLAIELAGSFVGGLLVRFIFLLLAMALFFGWIRAFVVHHVADLFV